MKKVFLSLLLTLLPLMASAATVEIDGLYYYLFPEENYAVLAKNDNNRTITNLEIPDSVYYGGVYYDVTVIGESAFKGSKNLRSIKIGKNVSTIEKSAFTDCFYLESLHIPSNVKTIEYDAFSGLNRVSSIILEYGLEHIGADAFAACKGITNLKIPNSVVKIESSAFSMCSGLRSVILSENITELQIALFSWCSNLESVVIGSKVTNFSPRVFDNCESLKDIYLYAEEVPQGVNGSIDKYTKLDVVLHVPAVSVDKYKKTEDWKGFKDIVALTNNDPTPIDANTDNPEPSGINAVENRCEKKSFIFDLSGKRIDQLKKGINIIDGKKRLIK